MSNVENGAGLNRQHIDTCHPNIEIVFHTFTSLVCREWHAYDRSNIRC